MIDDPVELLARANPVPPNVTPPPIAEVLARITDEPPASGQPGVLSRARPLRLLAPAAGIAVALAVAAAAIVLVHGPARRTPVRVGSRTTPSTPPTIGFVPKGGMRGIVGLAGLAFTSRRDGIVSFQQCTRCSSRHPRTRGWLAITRDAGRSWKVSRAPYTLQSPLFADARNGWAFGTSSSRAALYYVTHDGGASWTPAHLAAGQIAYTTPLAVAGGTVWAIGNRCSNQAGCTYAVLRGSAAGSTLSPTAAQPAPDAETMMISAGSARTAYATTAIDNGRAARTYATHDSGRHWAKISSACPDGAPSATGDGVLWETCGAHAIAISDNAGTTWRVRHAPPSTITDLVPASATTAWALTRHNTLLRTTDAGRTWHAYQYAAPRLPRREAATPSPLGVLSARSAAIAVDYPTGHGRTQIMLVRALGRKDLSSFIRLPAGLG